MPTDAAALIARLRRHLNAFEFPEAAALVDAAIGGLDGGTSSFDQQQRRQLLGALRGARQFDSLAKLAQALMRAGHDDSGDPNFDPQVRRHYAQTLIEGGQISAAIDTLRTGLSLIATVPDDAFKAHDGERREMLGLLGRAYKQIYMDAAAAHAAAANAAKPAVAPLQASMDWYDAAAGNRTAVDSHWPLINKIAVSARSEWDDVPARFPPSHQMAREAIAALLPEAESDTPKNPGDLPWLRASLGEAYVAIGDWPNAARWYAAFADGDYVDAFQIASAIRQLVEVWRIDPDQPGNGGALVQMLRVRLVDKPGGGIILSDNSHRLLNAIHSAEGLTPQAILGQDWPMKLAYLQTGIERAKSVAAVYEVGDDRAIGTAFLIRGGQLDAAWGDEIVAITAAHVVSAQGAIRPMHARLQFEDAGRGGIRQFACSAEPLFQSPGDQLDVCVLRIKDLPADLEPAPVRDYDAIPASFDDMSAGQKGCVIIGHPEGGELAISLANSQLIDSGYKYPNRRQDIFFRYTTPTLGGNSGSPVYDKQWNVIGVHRAGISDTHKTTGIRRLSDKPGRHVANEGVALKSIAAEIARLKGGTSTAVTSPVPAAIAPQTLDALAAAIADATTPESAIATWLADPAIAPLLTDGTEPAPVTKVEEDGLTSECHREVSQILAHSAAVALSKAFRSRRNSLYKGALTNPAKTRLTFVSEGDSWFQYPLPMLRDTIDHLSTTYPVHCRAIAGMEVGLISAGAEDFFDAITCEKPDGVLLSGGGNDLLGDGLVVKYVKKFMKKASAQDHLSDRLERTIAEVLTEFETLIAGALELKPDLKFFLHGYDRAFPKRNGRWLRRPLLDKRGIESMKLQGEIVAAIVDRYNIALAAFAAQRPGVVHYVDCRGAVGGTAEWYDELHPRTAGFGRVAERFDRSIRQAFRGHAAFGGQAAI